MYNKISDLRTNPKEYQKPFNPKNQKITDKELENILTEYFHGKKGIEISRKERKNDFEERYYSIFSDSVKDFIHGDFLMGFIKTAEWHELTYSLIVREGKRMVGFIADYNGHIDDGMYFSEKDNEIIRQWKEFDEPDKINKDLTEENYREVLLTAWNNVQTGSPRFFK